MPRRQRNYMRTKAGRRLLAERIVAQDRMVEDLGGGLFGKALEGVQIQEVEFPESREALARGQRGGPRSSAASRDASSRARATTRTGGGVSRRSSRASLTRRCRCRHRHPANPLALGQIRSRPTASYG